MIKILSLACVSLVLLAGFATDASAYGGHRGRHHSHHRHHGANFGFYFGAPLFWGPSYYRRYAPDYYRDYYYEPRIIIERDPPVYIQRQPVQQAQAAQLWYYCPNPAGYYPHVASCSKPWVPVDPRDVPPAPSAPR